MRKIYIAHEYGDESHFKALYDKAELYGYSVSGQIILKNKSLLSKVYKTIVKDKNIVVAIKLILNKLEFFGLRNQILVVGIAPYNFELNRYKKIFKRNKSFYFTSQIQWDGSDFIEGTGKNRYVFEELLNECFKGAFCITEKTAQGVSKFISNTSVVNHSIKIDEYKHLITTSSSIRFLYLGQYVERKNINLIIEWFKMNKEISISVDFYGRGNLETDINEYSINDNRVKNNGFASKLFLKDKICEYDYLILPSEDEPFGIVLIEALASGVPCIVSDAAGPSEIITNGYNGFVFSLKDKIKDFHVVMNKVVELPIDEKIRLRKNALESSTRYDTSQIIKKWMILFDSEE